jgi:hypothetical protein
MEHSHGVFTVVAVVVFKLLSWALILWWQLPVHFAELFSIDRSKTSLQAKFHSYFLDSDSKVHLTGIMSAPTSMASATAVLDNSKHSKGTIKTWWSAGERDATMEMSYVSAVISKQTPFFKNGVFTSPAAATAHLPAAECDELPVGRDRGKARDWEGMPEAIRQSRGRFTLRGGGKTLHSYSDHDLHKNIEGRSRGMRRGSNRKIGKFKGWNKQVVSARSSAGAVAVGEGEDLEAEAEDVVQELGATGGVHKSWMGLQQKGNGSTNDPKRRGTANVQYDDFIPQRQSGPSSKANLSDSVAGGDVSEWEGSADDEEAKLEIARKIHNDILWTENPSISQATGTAGFRLSDMG